MDNQNLLNILNYIDPAVLDYQEWVNVGMALKDAGYTASDWDNWSRQDAGRYHSGECVKKWDTFSGSPTPVTVGTIVQYAKDQGWTPAVDAHELDWDDVIGARDEMIIVDKNWVEGREITEPDTWDPVQQLIKYLETLFEAGENVGYVCESWKKEGKYLPKKGCWDRTAGQLIQDLNQCNGDIGKALGDYNPDAGAWIRFNPFDGKDIKNENVTEYRYALVESDDVDLEKQNAIIRELELPVACLVYSGKKSIHAIVKVEAADYDEYRKRVDYLYNVCSKNGLKVDTQNRNPSRLSRMPGVMRAGQKQFLIDTNIGKESWAVWKEWIEGINDDLPEPESMASVWDNLPDLAPPLINGLLRQGHKMLITGSSKAGKSFSLIELCCAIAEGKEWFGWPCAQGKVMYVNLELDRASCLHRFKDVYQALGWAPRNVSNIDIWNLRGKAVPMDKLAPKLIRRAQKKNYIAVVIDPIYKVITGDENSADQMAHFCNQFDRICSELSAAVIICHHHSKGSQGSKRSMDRASGSGVFARDPDALLDLIELELTDSVLLQEENKAICRVCEAWIGKYGHINEVSQDDLCSAKAMLNNCVGFLSIDQNRAMQPEIEAAKQAVKRLSAWRIEGTLREFPKFPPVNLWFDYPIHRTDKAGTLHDVEPEGDKPPWQRGIEKRKYNAKKQKNDKKSEFENAVNNCNFGEPPTVKMLSETLGIKDRTVRDWIKEYDYQIDKNTGTVSKNKRENKQ